MSQSRAHKKLVIDVVKALEIRFPRNTFSVDGPQHPNHESPFVIDNFKPDVYAGKNVPEGFIIIGEAKTDADLETNRSLVQVKSFLNSIEQRNGGFFVLSVSGCIAELAKTNLFFMSKELNLRRTRIVVFDGLDFWDLSKSGENIWLLN